MRQNKHSAIDYAALRESAMRRISKARAYLARSRNRKGETAMTASNTVWAREVARVWLSEYPLFGFTTDEAIPIVVDLILAVERKAKEECARLAEAMCPYPAQSATNMRNGIAIAIRSTLPPTSKTE